MEALTTQLGPGARGKSSPNSKQELQPYSGSSALKPNQVGETSLYGGAYRVPGHRRPGAPMPGANLFPPPRTTATMRYTTAAWPWASRACSAPVQLEILRQAGAMPISSRRCGMITKREAERLCKSFSRRAQATPNCPRTSPSMWCTSAPGARGSFIPARYNSSRAKCIKCGCCSMCFSPNSYLPSHRTPDAKYTQPTQPTSTRGADTSNSVTSRPQTN